MIGLEIIELYEDHLYTVKFEDQEKDEYTKAFTLWKDLDYLVGYFSQNKHLLDSDFWVFNNIPVEPEDLAGQIIKESIDYENYIRQIVENSRNGKKNDLDSFFKVLGGKYHVLHEYIPHKSYGTGNPTMLRIYAIRMGPNCYIIVHGGIKLTKEIQGTPELDRELFSKIDRVISYLKNNGVDLTDLKG